MSASQTFQLAAAEFPAAATPRERLRSAVKYALLAPTQFDWPPWEFRLRDTHIDLIVEKDPDDEELDGDRRELMIGCGAALQYLKVALKHFGSLGRVELFPDLDRRALAARIHSGFGCERDARETALFEAITTGRERSSSFGNAPTSEGTLAALTQAVGRDRSWMELTQNETSRQRVIEMTLATEPDRQLTTSPAVLGVVKTKTDDEHGWLAAGQTLAKAALQAQAWGIPWDLFDPVSHRRSRESLRLAIGQKGFPQAVLNFGSLMTGPSVRLVPATTATATARFG